MRATTTTATRRLVLVLLTVVSTLLVTAAPALASDVVLGALDAVCADDDSDGISFSVGTDREGEGAEHPAIRVEWKPAGAPDSAYSTLGTGPLTPENGYTYSDTVTGLDFGDSTQVTIRATALKYDQGGGPWGDGRYAGDKDTRTISVEECGNGDPGENARMNFTAGCETSAGEPAALLFNEGIPGEDADLTFELEATFDSYTMTETVELAPGESATVLLVFIDAAGNQVSTEDGTVDVRVAVGDTVLERSIDVDCEGDQEPRPSASVDGDCTSTGGAIVASMDNPTDAPVTFVVTIDGEVVDEVTLEAGTSDEREYAVADGTHTATIEADNAEMADSVITIECDPSPSAEVTTECFTDVATIEISLINPDPTPTTFVVTVDGTEVDTIEVSNGAVPVSVTVDEGVHEVLVTADGETVYDESVNVSCGPEVFADASVDVVCAPTGGRVIVTVDNPGDVTTAQLLVDGELVADVDVPSLELTEITADGLVDGAREVTVIVGADTLLAETVDVDCTEVLGETDSRDPSPDPGPVVAGEQLPNAGAESVAWVLFALLLVFFGGDLVLTELRARLRRG